MEIREMVGMVWEMKISGDRDLSMLCGGIGAGDYGIAMEIAGDIDLAARGWIWVYGVLGWVGWTAWAQGWWYV